MSGIQLRSCPRAVAAARETRINRKCAPTRPLGPSLAREGRPGGVRTGKEERAVRLYAGLNPFMESPEDIYDAMNEENIEEEAKLAEILDKLDTVMLFILNETILFLFPVSD